MLKSEYFHGTDKSIWPYLLEAKPNLMTSREPKIWKWNDFNILLALLLAFLFLFSIFRSLLQD